MNTKEKLDQGYILARTIIEVVGRPKELVENSLKTYLEKIKEIKELELIKQEIAEIKEQEDVWTTFAELEILFKDMTIITQFCFNFMPSSIEIISPEQIKFKNRELSGILNNLQAKLHNLHAAAKHLQNENIMCKKNIQIILNNYISLLLFKSGKTLEKISKLTGLSEKNIEVVLNNMLKQERIKKEGDVYILIKNDQKQG